ncbi:MAG TPA: prepilin-type N-terminal cleavage/methylation domain-containing protein, partial [Nitrospiria bacterium]
MYSLPAMRPLKDSERGFSLTETLMVLAITGLLSGLALASFQSRLPQHRLGIAAREMVSDLRWARQLALAERRPVLMVLDLEGDRYWIEREILPGVPVGWVRNLRDSKQGFGGV